MKSYLTSVRRKDFHIVSPPKFSVGGLKDLRFSKKESGNCILNSYLVLLKTLSPNSSCLYFLLVYFSLYLFALPAFAEVSLRLKTGQNYGEYLEQIGGRGAVFGNSDPSIQGAGSRITYPNRFTYIGIGMLVQINGWRWESEFDSTLGYVYTGMGKNEDFYWNENSRSQVPGFDTSRWRFRDSGYSFENTDRFIIHNSKTSVLDHRWQNRLERDFFVYKNIHLYGILGLSFYKNYFISYDSSYYAKPNMFGYTANGNSFENKIVELQGGLGFRSKHFSDKLVFDVSFAPLIGLNRSEDHHVARNLHSLHSGFGNGFLTRLESKLHVTDNISFALRYTAHRFYSIGKWTTSGIPTNYEDLAKRLTSNSAGWNWITNKESRWEVYLEYKVK